LYNQAALRFASTIRWRIELEQRAKERPGRRSFVIARQNFRKARFGGKPPHPRDATFLMFVVGFVAAILINFFFGWLLLAEARETGDLPSSR
jgi:hypothetical protein